MFGGAAYESPRSQDDGAAQKKQEFGGAIIKLKKVDCEVDNIVDQNSSIVENNYEFNLFKY